MGYFKQQLRKRWLGCERLESRFAFSGLVGSAPLLDPTPLEDALFHAVIVAGESPDSPSARVDANSDQSIFDGVGSLTIATKRGNYICTGTPIDATHVVTAGHCVDINSDGKSDTRDGISSITFNVNYGSSYSSKILAMSWVTHPDFTGFNRPSINDDVAVLTLSQAIPDAVPKYGMFTGDLSGNTITLVGYGQSGDGIKGYTVGASYTVKRQGQNVVDAFYTQDDSGRTAANEVFRFDFDRDNGTNGPLGGPSTGNLIETTLGGGDSGGPSFVRDSIGSYLLAGVNTFTQGTAPKFGSLGGGMSIPAYAAWINSVVNGPAAPTSSPTTSSGGKATANSAIHAIRFAMDESTNHAVAVPFQPLVLSMMVREVDYSIDREQKTQTVERILVTPASTLSSGDHNTQITASTVQRVRSSNHEHTNDNASEWELLAAVDACYAFSGDSEERTPAR